jgi:hypothetical protein
MWAAALYCIRYTVCTPNKLCDNRKTSWGSGGSVGGEVVAQLVGK